MILFNCSSFISFLSKRVFTPLAPTGYPPTKLKNIVDSDSFKNIMKLPEHIKMNIESLYNKNFSENSRIFIDLKQSHFDYCKKNLRKVFEEFFCWSIYKYFFGKYFIKKIILKNLIN